MPSPLILKIQAQLDSRGFDDVRRQIRQFEQQIDGLGDSFTNLDRKFKLIGATLGALVTIQLGLLTRAGIEQEREFADLANTLTDFGSDAERAAGIIQTLTTAMARNSLFSRRELSASYGILARSTGSLQLASEDLALVQEIAITRNISLAQAAQAFGRALEGDASALANLTDLTTTQIEEFRRLGTIREEIAREFPIGEATGRELDTVTGKVEKLANRATAVFDRAGQAVFSLFETPIKSALDFVDEATARDIPLSLVNLGAKFINFINPFKEFTGTLREDLGTLASEAENVAARTEIIAQRNVRSVRLEARVRAESIAEQITLRRQLLNILQVRPLAVDETASTEERSRALTQLIQQRKENLRAIEDERLASLSIVRIQEARGDITEDELRRQESLIEARALAQRQEAEQAAALRAAEIGPVEGRPDIQLRIENQLASLDREALNRRRELIRERQAEIVNAQQLERIEGDITRLQELGSNITQEQSDTLTRLLGRRDELREALSDAFIPTSEAAIDNLVDEIERQLEVPPINVNLNIDRDTLNETVITAVNGELQRRGFDIDRRVVAPSGIEAE